MGLGGMLMGHLATMGMGQIPPSNDICKIDFGNSSFNLYPLQTPAFYLVQDSRNNVGSSTNYTYFFNVCGNTGFLPNYDLCNSTVPGSGYPGGPIINAPAPAYQLANFPVPDQDRCHRLGNDVTVPGNLVYGLYDSSNPSRGVYVQYQNGDACPPLSRQTNRSMRLWLLCYDDAVNVPSSEVVLRNDATCVYDIYVNSIYGCPTECAKVQDPDSGETRLCSGHGVCDFDRVLGTSRCFCNDGWGGSDCSGKSSSTGGFSAAAGVLIFVSILLAALSAFLIFLWVRITRLRLDPAAYKMMAAQPNA